MGWQFLKWDNDPLFLPESADNLSIVTEYLGDNSGSVFFKRSDIRQVTGPDVPEICDGT
jgi:hypothetical protein